MPRPLRVCVSYTPDQHERWRELRHYYGRTFDLRALTGDEPAPDLRPDQALAAARARLGDAQVLVLVLSPGLASLARVDHEIQAAVKRDGSAPRLALIGLKLRDAGETTDPGTMPPRFADNVRSGYAATHPWPEMEADLHRWFADADLRRRYSPPDSARPLMQARRTSGSLGEGGLRRLGWSV